MRGPGFGPLESVGDGPLDPPEDDDCSEAREDAAIDKADYDFKRSRGE